MTNRIDYKLLEMYEHFSLSFYISILSVYELSDRGRESDGEEKIEHLTTTFLKYDTYALVEARDIFRNSNGTTLQFMF